MGLPKGEEKERVQNFPQINFRPQTTDPGSSGNTSRINTKKTTTRCIIFKQQNIKINCWKKGERPRELESERVDGEEREKEKREQGDILTEKRNGHREGGVGIRG